MDELGLVMQLYCDELRQTCARDPTAEALATSVLGELLGRMDEPAPADPRRPPRFGEANSKLHKVREERVRAHSSEGQYISECLRRGPAALLQERATPETLVAARRREDRPEERQRMQVRPTCVERRKVLALTPVPRGVLRVKFEVRNVEGEVLQRGPEDGVPVSDGVALLDVEPLSMRFKISIEGLDAQGRVSLSATLPGNTLEQAPPKFQCTTRLEMDFESAVASGDFLKDFVAETARLYGVEPQCVEILGVERGSTIVTWTINPANSPIPNVAALLYPQFDRSYLHADGAPWANDCTTGGVTLTTAQPLTRGGDPYWCPLGWKRYALFVDTVGAHPANTSHTELPTSWAVAYHGTSASDSGVDPTKPAVILDIPQLILKNGFKPSAHGCYLPGNWQAHGGALYTTPSIEYAGADRYAKPFVHNGKWYQIVFQLKVNKAGAIARGDHFIQASETLGGWDYDHNWPAGQLEWLFRDLRDVKLCGIMVRSGNLSDLGPKSTYGLLRGRVLELNNAGRGKRPAVP